MKFVFLGFLGIRFVDTLKNPPEDEQPFIPKSRWTITAILSAVAITDPNEIHAYWSMLVIIRQKSRTQNDRRYASPRRYSQTTRRQHSEPLIDKMRGAYRPWFLSALPTVGPAATPLAAVILKFRRLYITSIIGRVPLAVRCWRGPGNSIMEDVSVLAKGFGVRSASGRESLLPCIMRSLI